MKKKDLVAKIAKEQNLDPKELNRLPIEELKKMDIVVPDVDASVLDAPETSEEDRVRHIIGYKMDGTPVYHPGI